MRLKLEGRLIGEWVALLEGELEKWHRTGRYVELDLEKVEFASNRGLQTLLRAVERGIGIAAYSPLLRDLMTRGSA